MHPKSAEEVFVRVPDRLSEVTKEIMSPMNAQQHPRETKSGGNVSQECRLHSWGAKEAESVTEGIRSKPKVHRAEKEYLTIKENEQNCQTAHFAYSVSFAISSFLKIPVYLSRNATLMVKVQDNGNEYEYNLQGRTPPNHLPARSRKYKRKNANLNNRGWS